MAELRNNKRKGTKAVGPSKHSQEQKKKRLSDDFAWPTSHLRPSLHWFTVRSTSPSRFIVDSCLHLGTLELALRVCCSSEIVCQNFPKLNYCSKVRLENAEKEEKKSFFPLAPSFPLRRSLQQPHRDTHSHLRHTTYKRQTLSQAFGIRRSD